MIGAFIKRDALLAKSHPVGLVLEALNMAFTAITFALIHRIVAPDRVTGTYLSFVMTGLALATILSAGVGVVSSNLRDEQVQGTLEATIVAGVPLGHLAAGMSAFPILAALVRAALYIAISALLGARAPEATWTLAIVATLVGAVSFAAIGLIAAAGVLIVRQAGTIAVWFTAVATLVAGTVVPESVLPGWVRVVSGASPFTHALRITRNAMLAGQSWNQQIAEVSLLAGLTAVWVALGLAALAGGLRWARNKGTLARF